MALDLKQLETKPWYWGLGIGVGLGALVYVAFAFYVPPNFSEMKASIAGKRNEIAQLETKINQGRAAERRLPQLREEVRRTELDLQRLLLVLPTAKNTEELIKKIEALTRQGDFFLKKFAPKEFVRKDFYAEWPIEIQLDGTYHNLALFFDKLARFSRIINVEDLVMTGRPGEAAGRTLGATFFMKTFIYVGDPEPAKEAGQAPKPRPPAFPKSDAKVGDM